MRPLLHANACRCAATMALMSLGGVAQADCRLGPPMDPTLLHQYLAAPAILLDPTPSGADGLRMEVQRLAIAGPEAIRAVLSIGDQASHAQQLAIGAGLAAAANLCRTQDSAIVQRIKNAVRSSESRVVEQAFLASFDDNAGDDAAASPSGLGETHRFASDRDRTAPRNVLPDDPTAAVKLPNPFGAPDEWR